MGLRAAEALLARFRHEGQYLPAWNPRPTHGGAHAEFVAGRVIADTMQNLALLHWAHGETGHADFRDVALAHSLDKLPRDMRDDVFHRLVPESGRATFEILNWGLDLNRASEVEPDHVTLHLSGTCSGCPGAVLTTRGIIEPAVHAVAPSARVVVTNGAKVPEGASLLG